MACSKDIFSSDIYPLPLPSSVIATYNQNNNETSMCINKHGNLFLMSNTCIDKITPKGDLSHLISNLENGMKCAIAKDGNIFVSYQTADVNPDGTFDIRFFVSKCFGSRIVPLFFSNTYDTEEKIVSSNFGEIDVPIMATCVSGQLAIVFGNTIQIYSGDDTPEGCDNMIVKRSIKYTDFSYNVFMMESFWLNSKDVIFLKDEDRILRRIDTRTPLPKLKSSTHIEVLCDDIDSMTIDSNDNLYFTKGNDIYILNTNQREPPRLIHCPESQHAFYNTIAADETGFYFIAVNDNTIKKIYCTNVYWRLDLHWRLLPFLRDQVKCVFTLASRCNGKQTCTLFGLVPKELIFVICGFICMPDEDIDE